MMVPDKSKLLGALLTASLVAPALSAQDVDPARERQAVRAADLGMAEAVAERDAEGFKAFVADDGVFLGAGVARGPAEAAAAWQVFLEPAGAATIAWAPKEAVVAASADLAYTIGDWTMYRVSGEERTAVGTGSYLTVWRKNEAGRWQVAADGSLVARDPLPPELGLESRNALAAKFPLLASPEVGVIHERQPEKVRIAASGDLAYSLGEYAIEITDANGLPTSVTGAYFTVWTREGKGPWKALAESLTDPVATDARDR
jgi:ketosteroid isomerase-like protein